jgi:hypothetical protein
MIKISFIGIKGAIASMTFSVKGSLLSRLESRNV